MAVRPHRTFFRLGAMDARIEEAPVLNRTKLLVGSDPRCDVVLAHRGISPQHCYLVVGEESVRVLDLASTNGIFVNGKRVREAELFPGDTLTVADLAFNVEAFESAELFHDAEAEVASLVAATAQAAAVFVPERAGLTLVDQEYCDLKLQESQQDVIVKPPYFLYGNYDAEDLDSTVAPLDLVEDRAGNRLEIVTYSSGQVLDVQFVDLTETDVVLSPVLAKGKIWFPGITSEVTLVKHEKGRWHVQRPEGFALEGEATLSRSHLFFTLGVHQISLRLVEQSFRVKPLPFLWRDRQFYKDALRVTASVFLPFLLLLFISLPEKEPEQVKQLTIIYKAVQKTDGEAKMELSATEVTSKTENTGQKSTEQPKTQTQMAAASAPAAAAQPQSEPAAAAPAKPKAYKFSSSVSLDSVVADAAPADAAGAGRAPAATAKGMGASSSALSGTGTGQAMGVGKLGSDASGASSASAGAKGLVAKKGFDHSYLEPKTVVLGSMDPELLRKILQEYLPQFRHCYQQELITSAKDIKGVIDLDFQISPDGRVSRADIKAKDARFSRKGTDCMASVLRIIEFPKPKGGGVVDVRQPLNFFAETEKI